MVSPEALREHWTALAPTHNHDTHISNPITEVGAARPTRNPPLERTHQGKLTTSWISPHPTKDLLKGSKLHQICDDGHLVTIHSPDGHCMAVLTRERATILWHWYWQTNPDAGSQETFAIEVATMCAHYSSNKLYIKNQKSTPQEMASQIAKAIGATTERFSSPLNANPTFRDYYSNRKADPQTLSLVSNSTPTRFDSHPRDLCAQDIKPRKPRKPFVGPQPRPQHRERSRT